MTTAQKRYINSGNARVNNPCRLTTYLQVHTGMYVRGIILLLINSVRLNVEKNQYKIIIEFEMVNTNNFGAVIILLLIKSAVK